MSNHLIHETSPYLLQHAENPVDWYPWNEEALQRAKEENKPIFLSIGYSACHWCHVMAHESFEDPEIAALLNQSFISIKVDREERPDLDSIYMSAVVAMTGQGGWPMSVFLTPEGKPFYGGTYFPPARRYDMPSFRDVLISIIRSWSEAPGEITPVAEKLARYLQESARWDHSELPTVRADTLQLALQELEASYDWQNGGWGGAPKFPAPMTLEFLLQMAHKGDRKAPGMAEHALRSMGRGGMYDVIGGGFHRYSTDSAWRIPHFEKMLYDNAQLALVYLHAYQVTGDAFFRRICEQTLDFMRRELLQPDGGFSSGLDADSEGEEGKFYTWTFAELQKAIDSPEDFAWLREVYEIQPNGNFTGKILLRQRQSLSETAQRLNLSVEAFEAKLDGFLARLFTIRAQRVRPFLDDKVLTFWNALAIQAFAEAGKALDRADYLQIAQNTANFIISNLHVGENLLRSWRNGEARNIAFLEDHAGLILALLALYQADFSPYWYQTALRIGAEMKDGFIDSAGGFFDTHRGQGGLLIRPKDVQDNATPSGNALAALALTLLAVFSEEDDWDVPSQRLLGALQDRMANYPNAFAFWLQVLNFELGPEQQVALVWPDGQPSPRSFLSLMRHTYAPLSIQAASPVPLPDGSPALLAGRDCQNHLPTVYLCDNSICKLPITEFETFRSGWVGRPVEENPTKPN
ncbi:highly conserved protein containing a thioredoxin domain [Longilinea arvoryzae]|uniref:Highly conserved protein containing a thioredoxin domain n=1 Tax=Longilinea arvoryzae TaxID=360412 RepID=A0A0S7BLR7_9CHLR|nr:thioredoxin domain-containing protein [Longilinea arvoryzae]GAP14618.1 highly conserved protein containing a thioredoxin domain [Longilinea arvoryzae]